MGGLFAWIKSFGETKFEIAVSGMQNAGKSSFVHVVQNGYHSPDLIPTVGFNQHRICKGPYEVKAWDMGGQKKFRGMWPRYSRGCDAMMYVFPTESIQ